jgi:predicted TIM-barrel fold metal-dependent hydrolase
LDEFRGDAAPHGFAGSVHIQVGAADAWEEAKWVQAVADANPDWSIAQVVYCDLTQSDFAAQLDKFQTLSTLRGVRQIIGRAPGEDAQTGTNHVIQSAEFLEGLEQIGARGLSFDLQLIPELMPAMGAILKQVPQTKVALCHAGSPHDLSAAGLTAYADALRHLSSLENVVCKLSGLGMFDHNWEVETIKPIIDICLAQFGGERCMFGSNFPVDKLYSDYAKLAESYFGIVPDGLHEAVFINVACGFYNLNIQAQ